MAAVVEVVQVGGGPDEFAVPVALGKNADEAWFAVEDSSNVGWCDAGVAPSGGDCEAHDVGGEVAHAVVKASHACGVAAGDLMEAGAVDLEPRVSWVCCRVREGGRYAADERCGGL